MSWQPQDYIALVSVVASPLAAMGGAWLNGHLSRREKLADQADSLRRETSAALGPMLGVLVDSEPSLVANAQLREYATPQEAVQGLYDRWSRARESLLVMHYSHPNEQVRRLAFELQAQAELSLRLTAEMIEGKDRDPRNAYEDAGKTAGELAKHLRSEA